MAEMIASKLEVVIPKPSQIPGLADLLAYVGLQHKLDDAEQYLDDVGNDNDNIFDLKIVDDDEEIRQEFAERIDPTGEKQTRILLSLRLDHDQIQRSLYKELQRRFLDVVFPIVMTIFGFEPSDHNKKIRNIKSFMVRYKRMEDIPPSLTTKMSPLVQKLVSLHYVHHPEVVPKSLDEYCTYIKTAEGGEKYAENLREFVNRPLLRQILPQPYLIEGYAELQIFQHSRELKLSDIGLKGKGTIDIEGPDLFKRVGRKEHIMQGLEILFKYIVREFQKPQPTRICALATFAEILVKWIHPFTDGNGRTGRALGTAISNAVPGVKIERIADVTTSIDEILEEYEEKWERDGIDETSAKAMFDKMVSVERWRYYRQAFSPVQTPDYGKRRLGAGPLG